ncbi:MAG: hypothetical protein CDV28_101121 [Candidatus Electronema aureum]|uniref:Uncharacterized protein n=1 Tax=Candidatus Electronema aureum TaxID=2005002 RepID=A0A521G5C2_9BACT|nr:MAG: hypothetical protein CDV28_101121 [Candidatus Electronema aureum]
MNQNGFKISQEKQEEFISLQYQALRNEILGIKERLIKVQLGGITAIPFIIGSGLQYKLWPVLLVSPVITLVFAFMVIFEQTSLMRAGAYLKQKTENVLVPIGFMGWEEWLERSPKGRLAENFFAWSVHIVFSVYFFLGLSFVYEAAKNLNFPVVIALGLVAFYTGGFSWALYVVIKYLPKGTSDFEVVTEQNNTPPV